MTKYKITWDAGYGEEEDIIEANSLEEAEEMAHERWKEEVESNADYSACVATDEDIECFG